MLQVRLPHHLHPGMESGPSKGARADVQRSTHADAPLFSNPQPTRRQATWRQANTKQHDHFSSHPR